MSEQKKTILICDDEEWVCSLLEDYLEGENYTVIVANDLARAREILKNPKLPDLLLLDIMLPDGNGMDFLVEVRSHLHTKTLPIIMVTAHRIETKDKISGFNEGADDYLVKPFDLKELKSRIDRLLARVESARSVSLGDGANKRSEFENAQHAVPKRPSINMGWKDLLGIRVIRKYFKLLLQPVDTLRSCVHEVDYTLATVIVLVYSFGMGIQWGIFNKSIYETLRMSLIQLASVGIGMLVIAGALKLILRKTKTNPTLISLLYVISLGLAPLCLVGVMGIPYVFISQGHYAEFTVSPLLLFPHQSADSIFGFWLKHFDLFELWGLGIFSIGLSQLINRNRSEIFWKIILIWFFFILLMGVLR